MSSNPCNYTSWITGVNTTNRKTWAAYGCLVAGQRLIDCTPALSVTQKRRCNCSIRLVALYKCHASAVAFARTWLLTVGDRAFPVAAARTWNDLPRHVTSASSLPVFLSRLKTHFFPRSFL